MNGSPSLRTTQLSFTYLNGRKAGSWNIQRQRAPLSEPGSVLLVAEHVPQKPPHLRHLLSESAVCSGSPCSIITTETAVPDTCPIDPLSKSTSCPALHCLPLILLGGGLELGQHITWEKKSKVIPRGPSCPIPDLSFPLSLS